MNIANHAFHAIMGATKPQSVEAICRKLDTGWHTIAVLESVFGIDSATDVQTALIRLDRLVERERSKMLAGHWSYNSNRLTALVQHRATLRNAVGHSKVA